MRLSGQISRPSLYEQQLLMVLLAITLISASLVGLHLEGRLLFQVIIGLRRIVPLVKRKTRHRIPIPTLIPSLKYRHRNLPSGM